MGLLGIGMVVIANRALLTVIGKGPPICIVVWNSIIVLTFAVPTAIFAFEEIVRRKRRAFRRRVSRRDVYLKSDSPLRRLILESATRAPR
jgi:hypothetical protein